MSTTQRLKESIVKNPALYAYSRRKHYQQYGLTPSETKHLDALATLETNGIVVFENYFSPEQVEKMQGEVKPKMDDLIADKYTGKEATHRFPEYGVYRLLELDNAAPSTKLFFDDEKINSLARAFVSPKVTSYQRMAESKPQPDTKSIADDWHFDDWKHRLKAFLYLSDVGENEAPFVYVEGTHHFHWWRFLKEWEYYAHPKDKRKGYFDNDEFEAIQKEHNYNVRTCTAKAGTVILADTRGLHRGSLLKQNSRLMLVNFFDVR